MKKFFTMLAVGLLAFGTAQAQWTPSDRDYHIIGEDSVYGQGGMKSLLTPDGNIVLTWTSLPKGMLYTDPAYGYRLMMQIFDKQGNAKFGKNGLIIAGKAGRTYTSDYPTVLAGNGDILTSFFDTRDDAARQTQHVYTYRYNQNGDPVWDKDGIRFDAINVHSAGSESAPQIAVSGNNIFMGCLHDEIYNVKADSTNWEPSPWVENDSMPDSITIESGNFQIQRMNDDGTAAWAKPMVINTSNVWMYPAPNGNIYLLYQSDINGLDAELIDKDGNNVWGDPVTIEDESLTSSDYFPAPVVTSDGEGGLTIAYRRLMNWSGYIVVNRLTPDGKVLLNPAIPNGTTDGDGNNPKIATKDGKVLVEWSYDDVNMQKNLMVNELNTDGTFAWTDSLTNGFSAGQNDMWGFTPVTVIPQDNGWVLFYGDLQSWNGANFYCTKIDNSGKIIWKKQIAENDFKSTGFSVVNDDKNAYIFYTCDREIGDDWQEIPGPGGLRVMVVDISDTTNGISSVHTNANNAAKTEYYKLDGTHANNMSKAGLYIVKDANGVHKTVVKE